jgi:hypothetical protein
LASQPGRLLDRRVRQQLGLDLERRNVFTTASNRPSCDRRAVVAALVAAESVAGVNQPLRQACVASGRGNHDSRPRGCRFKHQFANGAGGHFKIVASTMRA